MCQAPVGKVVGFDKDGIIVEYKGNTRKLRSRLPEVKEGDYVLFSLDIAVDKVDAEEATAILGNMR
jgi:hydrogenase maturation factor